MTTGTAFIAVFAALGLGQALLDSRAQAQGISPSGYVLGPDAGEPLTRGPTTIRVKADPTRGAKDMALGTQLLPKGAGIPVHKHLNSDEVLYVLEGTGTGVIGDVRSPVEKGSSIFIPRGAWHGVENPNGDLVVLWAVSPPGLEVYFRESSPAPGAAPLPREKVMEIGRKNGMDFK